MCVFPNGHKKQKKFSLFKIFDHLKEGKKRSKRGKAFQSVVVREKKIFASGNNIILSETSLLFHHKYILTFYPSLLIVQ